MAAKKSQKEIFVVGTSSCGDTSQLYLPTDCDGVSHTYKTLAEAKKHAPDAMDNAETDLSERPERVYILKVVAEGSPKAVAWES